MKKIIIIISIINFACTDYIFGQSKNIQNAYNSYNRTDRDGVRLKMKEAKDFIDLAYNHESTSNDPKMWNYRAKIYLEIMQNFPELDPDAIFKATESHIRCLDKDKKGRVVVRRWTREEEVINGLLQCGDKLFNTAVQDYNNKDYDKALKKYKEMFRVLPLDKDNLLKIEEELIYRYMSYAARDLGATNLQKEYLQKCIDLSSLDPSVYTSMSAIYVSDKDYEIALDYIRLGLLACGSDDMTLIGYEIDILREIGSSNSEIIDKLTKAIELDDLNEVLYIIRAELYADEKLYDQSEEDLNYVIREIDPNSELAINRFTSLYNVQIMDLETLLKEGGLNRSRKSNVKNKLDILYTKSLPYLILNNEINPDNKAGLNNLATIYYKLDMVKESQAIRKQLNSLK